MGNKDIVTKELMQKPEYFADAFNFYLFHGEQVIQPEYLAEVGTAEPIIFPEKKGKKLTTNAKDRDEYKGLKSTLFDKYNNPVYDLLLGIENQSVADYMMPVQCALYDFYGLWLQNQRNKKKKLTPVLTLVIHFESANWNYPLSVKDIYQQDNIWYPKVEALLPDYRMNLITPRIIEESDFGRFHTQLGRLLWFLKRIDLIKKQDFSDPRFQGVERDVARTFRELSGYSLEFKEPEEVTTVNLGDALRELRADGKAEGRSEGRAEGFAEGQARGRIEATDNIIRRLWAMGSSVADIAKACDVSPDYVQNLSRA